MLHAGFSLITTDPLRLSESMNYIEAKVRPTVESQPGNLGMSVHADPELGVAVLESFWVSVDALIAGEHEVAPVREGAVHRDSGTITFEPYALPVFELEARMTAGGASA